MYIYIYMYIYNSNLEVVLQSFESERYLFSQDEGQMLVQVLGKIVSVYNLLPNFSYQLQPSLHTTYTYIHTYIHTYSSCNAETGRHEACKAECCPVSALQLLWLMLGHLSICAACSLHICRLFSNVNQLFIKSGYLCSIHVGCLVTSTKYIHS